MSAVPFILPVFVPWWLRRRYMRTSREGKRYEATTRLPLYASFSSILKVPADDFFAPELFE